MNDKHLHILVPTLLYDGLVMESERAKVSISQLVRDAIESVYTDSHTAEIQRRKAAYDQLLEHRKSLPPLGAIPFREWREDGHGR
jgi:hypothetical protein